MNRRDIFKLPSLALAPSLTAAGSVSVSRPALASSSVENVHEAHIRYYQDILTKADHAYTHDRDAFIRMFNEQIEGLNSYWRGKGPWLTFFKQQAENLSTPLELKGTALYYYFHSATTSYTQRSDLCSAVYYLRSTKVGISWNDVEFPKDTPWRDRERLSKYSVILEPRV